MICPTCRQRIETERSISPRCKSPIWGRSRGKHVTQPRELPSKFLCPHGKPGHWECVACERKLGDEDCQSNERRILMYLKELCRSEAVSSAEAWRRAKEMLAAIDL